MRVRSEQIRIGLVFLTMGIASVSGQPAVSLNAAVHVLYVDADAMDGGDGLSWKTAFRELGDAIQVARDSGAPIREIRVAQGAYLPIVQTQPGDPRSATFELLNGIAIKGGYAGLGEPDPDRRDFSVFETVLSGDLAGDDGPDFSNNEENCYHVATAAGVDDTAVLDGFTITGGNAEASDRGGGVSSEGSPTFRNMRIVRNFGTGMMSTVDSDNSPSKLTLFRCDFIENDLGGLGQDGSHSASVDAHIALTECRFLGNAHSGFRIAAGSSATLVRCSFISNESYGMSSFFHSPGEHRLSFSQCHFRENLGYGVFIHRASASFTECTFTGQTYYAIFHHGIPDHRLKLERCKFRGNAGGVFFQGPNLNLVDCEFVDNVGSIGALHISWFPDIFSPVALLTDCRFVGNSAAAGGAVFNSHAMDLRIRNCEFIANSGSALCNESPNMTVLDSKFVANEGFGAAIHSSNNAGSLIEGCHFVGNGPNNSARGAIAIESGDVTLKNCLLAGNRTTSSAGSTLYCYSESNCTVTNCTIVDNGTHTNVGRGISAASDSAVTVENSVLWNASADGVPDESAQISGEMTTVGHSCVLGLDSYAGNGNIGEDPLFEGDPDGNWTGLPTYDPRTHKTTFTVDGADWIEGAWVGKLLRPYVNKIPQSLIVANTTNTITVWGNFIPDVTSYGPYTINDYHLTALSPCVETGDLGFVAEPDETDINGDRRVLGCRVDMGADEFVTGRFGSGDLNGDASVDTDDLRLFVETLVSGAPLGSCSGDMNQDGNHDGLDIQPFIESLLVL